MLGAPMLVDLEDVALGVVLLNDKANESLGTGRFEGRSISCSNKVNRIKLYLKSD